MAEEAKNEISATPWKAVRVTAGDGYAFDVVAADGFELASLVHESEAHLIAAAPELFKALAAIVEHCDRTGFLQHVPALLEDGRAALAKGKGGAQ